MLNPFSSTRSAVTMAAVAVVAAAGIVSAGVLDSGGHHKSATAPLPSTSTTRASSTSTSTTTRPPAKAHHRPPHRRPAPIVAPLTGLAVSAKVARQPAVVVKVDNVAQALPQAGINQADVVYEELVEGGLTRLAAIFQSQYPPRVEPVRSGRLTDEGIADDLDHPVLAYSGTNGIFQPVLAAQPLQDVTASSAPALFVRDSGRPSPHNYYVDAAGLAATDKPAKPPSARFLSFHQAGRPLSGAGVAVATGVSIPFPATSIQWVWNAPSKLWLRNQNGAPDVDTSGARLSATNVIVQFVPYVTSAYATGESLAQPAPIPHGLMVGSGRAWVLSDGRIVKGRWSRRSLTATTVFKDSAGKVIEVAPGRTWIELAPAAAAVSVTS